MIKKEQLKLIGEHFVLSTTTQVVNLAWNKLVDKTRNKIEDHRTRHISTVTFQEGAVFDWISLWIYNNISDCRHTTASTRWTDSPFRMDSTQVVVHTPAPNTYHIPVEYEGETYIVTAELFQNQESNKTEARTTIKLIVNAKVNGLLESIIQTAKHEFNEQLPDTPMLWTLHGFNWQRKNPLAKRDFDTVILKEGQKEDLVADIDKFYNHQDIYSSLGVPYKRGYLLYGPPGTGKTSFIKALAHKYNKDLYIGDLSGVTDKSLQNLLSTVSPGSIILFEDIDTAFSAKKRSDKEGNPLTSEESEESGGKKISTLSGLLNAIDGMNSPENVLIFMTTNHIEYLDPALIRDGRIDYKLKLDYTDKYQTEKLYDLAFPEGSPEEKESFVTEHAGKSPAEVVGNLLKLYERK